MPKQPGSAFTKLSEIEVRACGARGVRGCRRGERHPKQQQRGGAQNAACRLVPAPQPMPLYMQLLEENAQHVAAAARTLTRDAGGGLFMCVRSVGGKHVLASAGVCRGLHLQVQPRPAADTGSPAAGRSCAPVLFSHPQGPACQRQAGVWRAAGQG